MKTKKKKLTTAKTAWPGSVHRVEIDGEVVAYLELLVRREASWDRERSADWRLVETGPGGVYPIHPGTLPTFLGRDVPRRFRTFRDARAWLKAAVADEAEKAEPVEEPRARDRALDAYRALRRLLDEVGRDSGTALDPREAELAGMLATLARRFPGCDRRRR